MADRIKGQKNNDPVIWIRPNMIKTPLLNHYEKMVYLVLKTYANNETSRAFPSHNTIAKYAGISKTTVKEAIKGLVDKGIIQKEYRYREDSGQTSNIYTLMDSKEIWESATVEEIKRASAETEVERSIRILKKAGYSIKKEPSVATDQSSTDSTFSENNDNTISNNNNSEENRMSRYDLDEIKTLYNYELIKNMPGIYPEDLDAVVNILFDVLNTSKKEIRVAGENKDSMVVISKLMKLTPDEIGYAIEQFNSQKKEIKNVRAYMLTLLYNAKEQYALYITNRVNVDMHNGQ